jgi:hypothetical protein
VEASSAFCTNGQSIFSQFLRNLHRIMCYTVPKSNWEQIWEQYNTLYDADFAETGRMLVVNIKTSRLPSSTSVRDFAGTRWALRNRTVSSFWLPHLDIAVPPPFHEFHVGDLPAKEVKCRLERRYKLQIHAFHQKKIFFFFSNLPAAHISYTNNQLQLANSLSV